MSSTPHVRFPFSRGRSGEPWQIGELLRTANGHFSMYAKLCRQQIFPTHQAMFGNWYPSRADFSSFRFEHSGKQYSIDKFLDETDTDGLVILHRGKVILEHYGNGMTSNTPHILMSVSKSLTAVVAGILIEQGKLDPEQAVVSIIPELGDSVYSDATVRHVLDMRVGLDFDEDYLATSGPIVEYRKSTNWNPLGPGERPSDLRTYLATLKKRSGPDGGPFHYVSTNTDLLGWILERASGIRFADLLSTLLVEADGRPMLCLRYGRSPRRASLRWWYLHHNDGSRPRRPVDRAERPPKRHADHPCLLDRRHARWRRSEGLGGRRYDLLFRRSSHALSQQVVRSPR